MTSPSDIDIDNLSHDIARDGTVVHQRALGHLADAAEAAGFLPGAISVLRDIGASETVRARAFLVVARNWRDIVASSQDNFDEAFAALAAHWQAHQQLRDRGDIAQLARSGQRLDELRFAMCLAR